MPVFISVLAGIIPLSLRNGGHLIPFAPLSASGMATAPSAPPPAPPPMDRGGGERDGKTENEGRKERSGKGKKEEGRRGKGRMSPGSALWIPQ